MPFNNRSKLNFEFNFKSIFNYIQQKIGKELKKVKGNLKVISKSTQTTKVFKIIEILS